MKDNREQHRNNLLIISCSSRKSSLHHGAALYIYDGPMLRMLRKHPLEGLDTKIISAKYGLIDARDNISTYDMKMTKSRALELRGSITKKLEDILKDGNYNEAFIELGKTYQMAINLNFERFSPTKFVIDSGGIGVRLHNLKSWLERN